MSRNDTGNCLICGNPKSTITYKYCTDCRDKVEYFRKSLKLSVKEATARLLATVECQIKQRIGDMRETLDSIKESENIRAAAVKRLQVQREKGSRAGDPQGKSGNRKDVSGILSV